MAIWASDVKSTCPESKLTILDECYDIDCKQRREFQKGTKIGDIWNKIQFFVWYSLWKVDEQLLQQLVININT